VFYARADNISYDFDVYNMAAYNPAYFRAISEHKLSCSLLLSTNNSNSSEEGPDATELKALESSHDLFPA
jgi:hypothetical protein